MVARLAVVLAGCAFWGACVTTYPTSAEVARWEYTSGGEFEFRYCSPRLGWSEGWLYAVCGQPLATYPFANDSKERCHVYESVGHALWANVEAADYYLVCVENTERDSTPNRWDRQRGTVTIEPATSDEEEREEWEVVSVYGLNDVPD
jgi:hypothetical protein